MISLHLTRSQNSCGRITCMFKLGACLDLDLDGSFRRFQFSAVGCFQLAVGSSLSGAVAVVAAGHTLDWVFFAMLEKTRTEVKIKAKSILYTGKGLSKEIFPTLFQIS